MLVLNTTSPDVSPCAPAALPWTTCRLRVPEPRSFVVEPSSDERRRHPRPLARHDPHLGRGPRLDSRPRSIVTVIRARAPAPAVSTASSPPARRPPSRRRPAGRDSTRRLPVAAPPARWRRRGRRRRAARSPPASTSIERDGPIAGQRHSLLGRSVARRGMTTSAWSPSGQSRSASGVTPRRSPSTDFRAGGRDSDQQAPGSVRRDRSAGAARGAGASAARHGATGNRRSSPWRVATARAEAWRAATPRRQRAVGAAAGPTGRLGLDRSAAVSIEREARRPAGAAAGAQGQHVARRPAPRTRPTMRDGHDGARRRSPRCRDRRLRTSGCSSSTGRTRRSRSRPPGARSAPRQDSDCLRRRCLDIGRSVSSGSMPDERCNPRVRRRVTGGDDGPATSDRRPVVIGDRERGPSAIGVAVERRPAHRHQPRASPRRGGRSARTAARGVAPGGPGACAMFGVRFGRGSTDRRGRAHRTKARPSAKRSAGDRASADVNASAMRVRSTSGQLRAPLNGVVGRAGDRARRTATRGRWRPARTDPTAGDERWPASYLGRGVRAPRIGGRAPDALEDRHDASTDQHGLALARR